MSRKDFIDSSVKKGAYIKLNKEGRRLMVIPGKTNEGIMFESDITKTGMDYLEYIIQKDKTRSNLVVQEEVLTEKESEVEKEDKPVEIAESDWSQNIQGEKTVEIDYKTEYNKISKMNNNELETEFDRLMKIEKKEREETLMKF
jgi:hypothetical protein